MGKATARQTCKKSAKKRKNKPKCMKNIKVNKTKGLCSPKSNRSSRSRNGKMKLRRSNQTSCRTSSNRSSKQKKRRTPRAPSCCSTKSGISEASRSIRSQSPSCSAFSENASSSIRSSRQKRRRTPRKSRNNSCDPSCGSTKSGISKASRSNGSQSPSCSEFSGNPSSNAASRASSDGSIPSCATDKTTAFGNQKLNGGDSVSCESLASGFSKRQNGGKNMKRSIEHDSPCSSAFSLPDQGRETGSNRTHVSCGSLRTRSEKRNTCDRSFRSNQSDVLSDSCSCCTPPPRRSICARPPKKEPRSITRKQNNVEKKCGANLKYQRCELSDEQSSAEPIENAKCPKEIQSPPKFKGTFVLQPERGDQLTADATKFAGTVTFISTQVRDSWGQLSEQCNGSSPKTKKQRIEEEADSANKNNYGRILTAHYRAAQVMRSCKQEKCQEQPEEMEEENEDEDEDEDIDDCNETPKCPPRKTSCRESKSSRRLAIKTAALVGYSYRMKDKNC